MAGVIDAIGNGKLIPKRSKPAVLDEGRTALCAHLLGQSRSLQPKGFIGAAPKSYKDIFAPHARQQDSASRFSTNTLVVCYPRSRWQGQRSEGVGGGAARSCC